MNSSVNFSTFLHSSDENDQEITHKNIFTTEVDNIETVDSEKSMTNNTSSFDDPSSTTIASS